jgi:hypothetical protein
MQCATYILFKNVDIDVISGLDINAIVKNRIGSVELKEWSIRPNLLHQA